jgi:hypothetical protein
MSVSGFLYRYLHHILEFAAFVISLVYYRYYSKTFMKWIAPFLGLIFAGELFTMMYRIGFYSNYFMAVAEVIFYGYIFYNLIEGKKWKTVIVAVSAVSISCYVGSYFFLDTDRYTMTFFSLSLIVFGFLISAIALVYLYQLSVKKATITNEPGFWIALGVIVFFSGISIVFSSYGLIVEKKLRILGWPLYHLVPRVLSVLLYTCIAIGVLTTKRKAMKRSVLSPDTTENE